MANIQIHTQIDLVTNTNVYLHTYNYIIIIVIIIISIVIISSSTRSIIWKTQINKHIFVFNSYTVIRLVMNRRYNILEVTL